MQRVLITIFLLAQFLIGVAQPNYDLAALLRQKKLPVQNRSIKPSEDGKPGAVYLSAAENDGVAWIEGLEFSNGTIEVDLKGRDVLQQSFLGIAFHGIDLQTLDAVYFRPFNFQSTDPVRKIHAVHTSLILITPGQFFGRNLTDSMRRQ